MNQKIALSTFGLSTLCCLLLILFYNLIAIAQENIPADADLVWDAYIAEGKPDISFEDKSGLYVGYWDSNDRNARRVILQFQLADIESLKSAKTITGTLFLYQAADSGESVELDVQARRIISDSAFSSVTWNQVKNAQFDPSLSASGIEVSNILEPTGSVPFKQWQWNVTPLLDSWKKSSAASDKLMIILTSLDAETVPNRYRGFISKNCDDANCIDMGKGFAPKLIITYSETVASDETSEPSPTSTPEPTPGIKSISMTNAPTDTLNVGDIVTYTIHIENGEFPLTDLTIANPVPSKLEVITATLPVTATVNVENVVNWTIDNLAANQRTTASYQARVPIQKPTGLFIKGIAPFYTVPGPNKTYLLTVTNHSPITATQLVITSTIPNHIVVSSSSLSPADGTAILPPGDGRPTILEWAFSDFELAPSKQITVSFSGTILRDAVGSVILHDQYNVRAKQLDGSSFAPVEKPFDPISIVVHNSSPDIAPTQQYIPPVYAKTACVFWEYLVTKINEKGSKCTTSPIANPAVNYIFAPLLYGQGVVDE